MRVTDPMDVGPLATLAGAGAGAGDGDVAADAGRSSAVARQLLNRCWLAFLSDDLPTDAVVGAHPDGADPDFHEHRFTASLDHTLWFHRPIDVSQWHLHDFSCLHLVGGRGLAVGHVFTADGVHAATVAQEVLLRDLRSPDRE